MQSLDNWKSDTKEAIEVGVRSTLVDMEHKLVDMEYKLVKDMISQKKELADFRSNRSLENRVTKIEAHNAQMQMEIKVISVIVFILPTHECFIL